MKLAYLLVLGCCVAATALGVLPGPAVQVRHPLRRARLTVRADPLTPPTRGPYTAG
jgi:hypothetical protein